LWVWCCSTKCNFSKGFFLWPFFELILWKQKLVGCLLNVMVCHLLVEITKNLPWTLCWFLQMVKCYILIYVVLDATWQIRYNLPLIFHQLWLIKFLAICLLLKLVCLHWHVCWLIILIKHGFLFYLWIRLHFMYMPQHLVFVYFLYLKINFGLFWLYEFFQCSWLLQCIVIIVYFVCFQWNFWMK